MLIVPDERHQDLSLDRSPDLLDGIESRRIRRKMHKMDVVAGGILPDKDRMMGFEVVKDNDEPLVWICPLISFQHFPDVFLFGALPECDDGRAVDGKDATYHNRATLLSNILKGCDTHLEIPGTHTYHKMGDKVVDSV